jgi:hypothetical protein
MILVDTGPLVAIADPKDVDHKPCGAALKSLKRTPLKTTVAVLTEVFHTLGPSTRGADFVRDLVLAGAVTVWWFDAATLPRAFELMDTYADHPMDLADASLVVAAEALGTRRVFTLDREDFGAYRIRRGHRHYPFELVPVASA